VSAVIPNLGKLAYHKDMQSQKKMCANYYEKSSFFGRTACQEDVWRFS